MLVEQQIAERQERAASAVAQILERPAGSRYQFLGKLPLRKADRWHLGISTAAIIALGRWRTPSAPLVEVRR
jgi:hypothetical protein